MSVSLSDYFLTQIVNYGPPLLAVSLLLGALGFPVPGTFLVVAAGAFVKQGILSAPEAALFGFIGAVAGDSLSFGLGFSARGWVEHRFGASSAWQSARAGFDARGGISVYLTRFLLTALAIPTNLIAGGSGFGYWRFLAYDAIGEVTWIALYGGLGYWFGSQWELVSNFISDFGGLAVGVVVLVSGIVLALRRNGKNGKSPTRPKP